MTHTTSKQCIVPSINCVYFYSLTKTISFTRNRSKAANMKLAHPCNRHAFFIYANRKVPFSELREVTCTSIFIVLLKKLALGSSLLTRFIYITSTVTSLHRCAIKLYIFITFEYFLMDISCLLAFPYSFACINYAYSCKYIIQFLKSR